MGMSISRRSFLKAAAVLPFASSIENGYLLTPEFSKHKLAIMQGPTSDSVTQLSIDLNKNIHARYVLVEISTGRKLEPELLRSASRSHSKTKVEQVRFQNLKLGQDYLFQVFDSKNKILDQRTLRPLDIYKPNPRIAFMSCMLEFNTNLREMWRAVEKSKPDVLFFLGDNVYADIMGIGHSPIIMWSRYINTRHELPYYHWPELIPTIAIWDDHDFGLDDVDGDYKYRDHAIRTFKDFYAQTEISGFYENGPGISSAITLFGHDFIFLDGRFFRGFASQFGPALLGEEQLDWIKPKLLGTRPLWMSMGSQFFAGYPAPNNSYEHKGPSEFSEFKRLLAQANRPILLSSGDIHYSEIMQLNRSEFGFDAFEMTSSCLHSLTDRKLPHNPRRKAATLKENFIYLDVLNSTGHYQATCIGREEKIRFQMEIKF